MTMRPLLLLPCLLAVLLVGCGDPGAVTGDAAGPPDGDWRLVEGALDDDPVPIVDGHVPTLSVDGEEWSGTVCNHYAATVRIEDVRLSVTEVMSTEMACTAEGSMESESAYLAAFTRVDHYELEGDQLTLAGPDVELVYDVVEPEPDADLTGTSWELETIVEGDGPDGAASSTAADSTLVLEEDGLGGHTGCNHFGGSYEVDGDRLEVRELGSTLIGCDEAVAAQEEHLLGVLEAGPTFEIDGATLRLSAPDGRGLIYRAR